MYTYIGDILMSLNPFAELGIYSEKVFKNVIDYNDSVSLCLIVWI